MIASCLNFRGLFASTVVNNLEMVITKSTESKNKHITEQSLFAFLLIVLVPKSHCGLF